MQCRYDAWTTNDFYADYWKFRKYIGVVKFTWTVAVSEWMQRSYFRYSWTFSLIIPVHCKYSENVLAKIIDNIAISILSDRTCFSIHYCGSQTTSLERHTVERIPPPVATKLISARPAADLDQGVSQIWSESLRTLTVRSCLVPWTIHWGIFNEILRHSDTELFWSHSRARTCLDRTLPR